MGTAAVGGADLEARMVEQDSERIWPFMKSAVNTVNGS